jgi:hypothetical protein
LYNEAAIMAFPPAGIMPLSLFLQADRSSGARALNVRLLIWVRSIEPRKRFKSKTGVDCEKVIVGVQDTSASSLLELWGPGATAAVRGWIPGQTWLLLTDPELRGEEGKFAGITLGLGRRSLCEIDPELESAIDENVKERSKRLADREKSLHFFPNEGLEIAQSLQSGRTILYTLTELDEFCRQDSQGRLIPCHEPGTTSYLLH